MRNVKYIYFNLSYTKKWVENWQDANDLVATQPVNSDRDDIRTAMIKELWDNVTAKSYRG